MRGITSKLALSLLFIVSTVLLSFGYVDYRDTQTRLTEDLKRDIKIIKARLETSLPVPIWNYDSDVLNKILLSEIPEVFLAGMQVLDGSDKSLAGIVKNDKGEPELTEELSPVHSWIDSTELFFEENGERNPVGSLKLYVSDSHIQAVLRKNLESILIQLASTDLIILILFYFVLQPIVNPLKYLNEVARKIVQGDYSAEVVRRSRDEVGDLSESFNTMRLTIRKKMNDLATINSIGELLTLTYDRNKALGIVLSRLSDHARFENGSIFLADDSQEEFTIQGFYPERDDKPEPRKFRLGEGIIGAAVRSGVPVFVANTEKDERFVDAHKGEGVALLCVPMIDGDRIIGAINFSGQPGEVKYRDGDEEFMTSIARSLVITLKNIEMREEIEEHNRNLELKVQERTAALQSKTNDISAMMRNLQQGLFTILGDMSIHHEYSKFLEQIFETHDIAERPFMELLMADVDASEDEKDQVQVAVASLVGCDEMMWDFNSHLLPKELVRTRNGKQQVFEVDWNPIINDDEIEKIMVTVRDVTELRQLQLAAVEQKKDLDIISQILNLNVEKFYDFLESSRSYLEKNRQLVKSASGCDVDLIQVLFRNMHTIKGNSRTFGLTYITECAHLAEATYDSLRKTEAPEWQPERLLEELDTLENEVNHYSSVASTKLGLDAKAAQAGGASPDTVKSLIATLNEVVKSDVLGPYQGALEGQLKTLYSEVCDSLEETVRDVGQSLPSLAKAVDKPSPNLTLACNAAYLSKKTKGMLNDVLMHCLRNSVDHGIERAEERIAAGKEEYGTIKVTTARNNGSLLLSISDDGRGLALGKIRKKAIENGLIADNADLANKDIAELVFHSGLSTAEQVSQISGRGVGMDAVRNFVREVGGDIQLKLKTEEKQDFVPFETLITLPESLFERIY